MTLPRPVYPGSVYMVQRRCTQRQFLLRPDPEIVNAFIYCLAYAAKRHEIDIIDFIQITNHLHEVIFDRHGNAPAFYERFHGLLAKCVNAFRGRWENVFSNAQPSVITLPTVADLIDRLVYVATNPIKHNLVARIDDWPGASGYRALLNDTPLRATRPRFFFDQDGDMPAEITLRVAIPPEVADRAEVIEELQRRVEQYERDKALERASTGQKVLGRYALLRQPWDASPTSREPRRKLHRRIAAACRWAAIEALRRDEDFVAAYKAARVALLRGEVSLFPYGTYWIRKYAGALVQPAKILN